MVDINFDSRKLKRNCTPESYRLYSTIMSHSDMASSETGHINWYVYINYLSLGHRIMWMWGNLVSSFFMLGQVVQYKREPVLANQLMTMAAKLKMFLSQEAINSLQNFTQCFVYKKVQFPSKFKSVSPNMEFPRKELSEIPTFPTVANDLHSHTPVV